MLNILNEVEPALPPVIERAIERERLRLTWTLCGFSTPVTLTARHSSWHRPNALSNGTPVVQFCHWI